MQINAGSRYARPIYRLDYFYVIYMYIHVYVHTCLYMCMHVSVLLFFNRQ